MYTRDRVEEFIFFPYTVDTDWRRHRNDRFEIQIEFIYIHISICVKVYFLFISFVYDPIYCCLSHSITLFPHSLHSLSLSFTISLSISLFFCAFQRRRSRMYSVGEDRWMEKRGAIYNDTHCHRLMMKNWLYVYRIRIRYKNVSGRGRKK